MTEVLAFLFGRPMCLLVELGLVWIYDLRTGDAIVLCRTCGSMDLPLYRFVAQSDTDCPTR